MSGTASEAGFEEDAHYALDGQSLSDALELLVARAFLVVVLHVLSICELSLGDQGETLGTRVVLSLADNNRLDVRFSVLATRERQ